MEDGQHSSDQYEQQDPPMMLSGLSSSHLSGGGAFAQSGQGVWLRTTLFILVLLSVIGFTGRMFWWADLLGYPRLHLAFILFCLGIICIFRRNLRMFLMAAVGLMINLVAVISALPNAGLVTTPDTTLPPGEIKVATLNVNVDNTDPEAVLAWITKEDPDIVMLIEANRQWRSLADQVLATLPFNRIADNSGRHGMILLSRFPLENATTTRAGPYSLPTLSVSVETPIGELMVIGVHPNAPTSANDYQARNLYLAQISAMAQTTGKPTLMMGDFAAVPWSSGFETIRNLPNLQPDVWKMPTTWPPAAGWFGLPLDNILLTVPYTSTRALLIKSLTAGAHVPGTAHLPLVATISLN